MWISDSRVLFAFSLNQNHNLWLDDRRCFSETMSFGHSWQVDMIIFELLEIKNSYVWNENCISMDSLE